MQVAVGAATKDSGSAQANVAVSVQIAPGAHSEHVRAHLRCYMVVHMRGYNMYLPESAASARKDVHLRMSMVILTKLVVSASDSAIKPGPVFSRCSVYLRCR